MKDYRDIVPNYDDYLKLQTGKYMSREQENPRWVEGQRRYIFQEFSKHRKDIRILDVSCGDGVGLRVFKELDFMNVVGVDYNEEKIETARQSGYPVHQLDIHNLNIIRDQCFDIVYSSHTLEHAYQPFKALQEFHRILKTEGLLYAVMPFPDTGPDDAHGGKYELRTNQDNPAVVANVIGDHGFLPISVQVDSFREPEIWITAAKI